MRYSMIKRRPRGCFLKPKIWTDS